MTTERMHENLYTPLYFNEAFSYFHNIELLYMKVLLKYDAKFNISGSN